LCRVHKKEKNGIMETINKPKQTLAFINDRSPIIDSICNDLTNLGFDILFRSEHIEDGITQLSTLEKLPELCIIDLDFYDKNVLLGLQELHNQYPSIKLIAHSDIDDEKVGMEILDIGFSNYLLIGSGADDFRIAIEKAIES